MKRQRSLKFEVLISLVLLSSCNKITYSYLQKGDLIDYTLSGDSSITLLKVNPTIESKEFKIPFGVTHLGYYASAMISMTNYQMSLFIYT